MPIVLNSDQIKATQKLNEFLNSDEKYFLLMGSAGTGKTSIIVNFLSNIPKKVHIAFSATTNKAVSVLENMMNSRLTEMEDNSKLRKSINFLTIHKLLKIKRKIDLEGNEIFITTIDQENSLHRLDSKSIYSYDIIVIDEVSMMSMNLVEKILKIKDKLNGKVIFVGDSAQLPPVNEESSCVFSLKIPKYKLSNIVRSSGNMMELSNQVRGLVLKNGNISLKKLADSKLQLYNDKEEWINKYISQVSKLFKKLKKNNKVIEQAKMPIMLTYTNKKCNDINKKVRNVLFNNPKDKYVEGDIIVFNTFYDLPTNKNKYYTSEQTYIKNVVIEDYHIKKLKPFDIINIRKRIKDLNITSEDVVTDYKGDEDTCSICLEEKKPDNLQKTICEHLFCKKCFKAWFTISETCPLCRMDFKDMKLKFNGDNKLTTMIDNLCNFNSDKHYKIWLLINGKDDIIMCIHEDSIEKHKKDLEEVKLMLLKIKRHIDKKYKHDMAFMNSVLTRLWDFYYFQFVDQFADIIYGYAITTHKSQGSTYKNVYVEMSDIISNNPNDKNSHQCLYTAVTRASNKIKIFY
jgi:thymidine kinase